MMRRDDVKLCRTRCVTLSSMNVINAPASRPRRQRPPSTESTLDLNTQVSDWGRDQGINAKASGLWGQSHCPRSWPDLFKTDKATMLCPRAISEVDDTPRRPHPWVNSPFTSSTGPESKHSECGAGFYGLDKTKNTNPNWAILCWPLELHRKGTLFPLSWVFDASTWFQCRSTNM